MWPPSPKRRTMENLVRCRREKNTIQWRSSIPLSFSPRHKNHDKQYNFRRKIWSMFLKCRSEGPLPSLTHKRPQIHENTSQCFPSQHCQKIQPNQPCVWQTGLHKNKKSMYSQKQAAILAYNKLVTHLEPFGYSQIPFSLSLWTHIFCCTTCCLCVDDFDVKYFTKDDTNHLLESFCSSFKVTVDWSGKNYCGFHLILNYAKGYVGVSMSRYIPKMLKKYNHQAPKNHSEHLISGPRQRTAKNDNMQKQILTSLFFPITWQTEYNKKQDLSFTTPTPSKRQRYQLSLTLLAHKPNLLNIQVMKSTCSWIIWRLTSTP